MLNISIFDITYSNYGKYLESNVFLQKQKLKQKKQREDGDLQQPDLKQRQRSLHSTIAKNNHQETSFMPGSTLNAKTVSYGGQLTKKNTFFASQKQQAKMNNTVGGTLGFRDDKNCKNTLNTSYAEGGNTMERPRTTSIGTAVFRSVERAKTPGFCHFFHRENQSEIKYQPKYDLITEKAPAFSISKAVCERVISDGVTQKPEHLKDSVVHLCTKNPLLKDVQELEVRILQEIVKDKMGRDAHDCHHKNKENKITDYHLAHTNNNYYMNNKDTLHNQNSQQLNNESAAQGEHKKRNSKLSISHPLENNSNRINTHQQQQQQQQQQQVQSKSFYAQRALRQRYSFQKQNTFQSTTEGNSPLNNQPNIINTLHISQLMQRSSISPQHQHGNFTSATSATATAAATALVQQTATTPKSGNKQTSHMFPLQKRRSNEAKALASAAGSAANTMNTLNNINVSILKENHQPTIQQISKTNPIAQTKSQELMQPKETKIGGHCNGQILAFAEMINTKNSFYDSANKKGFHIKIGKQTNRPNSVQRPVSQDEIRFNNFQLFNVKQDKCHPFSSYTQRRVFEPKDNAPSYDIHKVNYDRLLTNDHHNQGNVSFDSKPIDKIPTTKHEIMNQNMYSNVKNNEVLSASVRLDYPLIEQAYYKQSGVKRPQALNFEKSSPRKKNLFPKPDGNYKEISNGQTEQKQGFQDYTVTYYEPGDISNRHSNNGNNIYHF